MATQPGLHNRRPHIASKIRSLLISLTNTPSKYDEITPKIEYWIEYVLRERFTTVDELVEGVSYVAWDQGGSYASVGRFFKEFYDAPHRSEQARSFVDELCEYVLRWFAIAAAEDSYTGTITSVASGGGSGFARAASFVGYLVEWGLLSHELARQHLIKPLIAHDDNNHNRANATHQLFHTAGNTLLRGLLGPEDVQACFKALDPWIGRIVGLDAVEVQGFREIHAEWLERRDETRRNAEQTEVSGRGEDSTVAEVAAEIATPIALVPQDLPTAGVDSGIPSSILQGDAWSSSGTFVNIPATALSSPTLSISTISDLAPTELGEETDPSEEQTTTRHDTFYFEDGNVEIVCEYTVFRVHSTIISFASPKLRGVLSPTALLGALLPEGCPRIALADRASDFAVLLRVIYTPGFPARRRVPEFTLFASLLRMATKYGFSDLREQLVEDLKGAYPTKWEDFESARILGEDVFGSPEPHPNAVLNLFTEQNVRFAIPFASYCAYLGGFAALMSDEPGTALPRHTLARTIYGMGLSQRTMTHAAYRIAYVDNLRICPERACVLNAGINPRERRNEALRKVSDVLSGRRQGGVLSTPSLGDITCEICARELEGYHAAWRSTCWRQLPSVLGVAGSWDEV